MNRILDILSEGDGGGFNIQLKKDGKKRKKKQKDLTVAPLFKDADDYSEPPHENLLRLPFSLLEIAPKGSGKTTLLQNMLVWYYPYFDNIFIFSPTINLDYKWKQIIQELEIPAENLFKGYKEGEVSNLMGQIRDFNQGLENKEKIKCLLIFDDCVDNLPKDRKSCALNKLAMNHRHFNISHIIISQSFKKLDAVIRLNATGIILFNTDNTAERRKIFEELAGNLGMKEFERLYYSVVKEKYNFLYVNYDSRNIYHNFDKLIADLDCMPKERLAKLGSGEINEVKEITKEKSEKKEKGK
jgi:hypothetical protein